MALQVDEIDRTDGPVVTGKRVSSPHSRKLRFREMIGKGILWTAAALTIGVLVIIVGYIIVNGFYERRVDDSDYLALADESVRIDDDVEMTIVVNAGLRLRDLTYEQLREIFEGMTPFWGYITGQNRSITTICYDDGTFADEARGFLMGAGGAYGTDSIILSSIDEVYEQIRANEGGIGLVPTSLYRPERGIRTIGLRHLMFVTHPAVQALQAGRRLRTLTHLQVQDLLAGRTESWSEVGGPSIEGTQTNPQAEEAGEYLPLPVRPVLFSSRMPGQFELTRSFLSEIDVAADTVTVDTLEAFRRYLTETPGASGLIRAKEASALGLDPVEVRRVTHRVNLRPSFLLQPPSRAGAVGGISYIIINTIAMVCFVLLIATPIGVAGAVYIVEYAPQGILLNLLKLGTDTLAGIPSIIFGLFGLVFFSQFLGLQTGLISGTLTITMMILPTIIRTCEEALRSVPYELRMGSLSLGATKHQTILRVVLPVASPGILTGVILGIGRAVGETAAILFTMGSNMALLRSFNSPVRVLSVHLYMLIRENISIPKAFATATILVIIVFVVNFSIRYSIGRMNKVHTA